MRFLQEIGEYGRSGATDLFIRQGSVPWHSDWQPATDLRKTLCVERRLSRFRDAADSFAANHDGLQLHPKTDARRVEDRSPDGMAIWRVAGNPWIDTLQGRPAYFP